MSYRPSSHSHPHRDDGGRNSAADEPPMSRLFIICNKNNTEEDFRSAFERFGAIEEIWVVRDKHSGENKGVVYIKFCKTSSAAKALEEMNGKLIPNSTRAIKVLVASSRNQGSSRSENEQDKCIRLFVIIPKDMSEEELTNEFKQYGDLDSVSVIKDKLTKERKGFAYIKYQKFSHAANAFEQCNSKFKAVFAEPKSTARTGTNSSTSSSHNSNHNSGQLDRLDRMDRSTSRYDESSRASSGGSCRNNLDHHSSFNLPIAASNPQPTNEATLEIICSSLINQDQLWRLFDIIPGLEYCQLTGECGRNSNYASAVYSNADAAAYARDKLHALEYPPGERLIIKPGIDLKPSADNVFPFDGPSKELFCSVSLPAPAPMADPAAPCIHRCFIVCVPKALPSKMLINIFSRFGDLIDVYMLQNRNCGYAKYASESSAMSAIDVLHRAEICGVKLKVMEAEEPRDAKRKRYDE